MTDDLTLPAFLKGPRPGPRPGPIRWKKMTPTNPRPEAQGWEEAEMWEVTAGPTLCALAPHLPAGTYLYWVLVGRKWVSLKDRGLYVHRLPVKEWDRHKGKRRRG